VIICTKVAKRHLPTIKGIQARGVTSLRAIAAELNLMKVPSASGAQWSAQVVANVLARLK
jgi:hypothetical protein